MNFAGRDLAKIGLPFQIVGGAVLLAGIVLHYLGHDDLAWIGMTDGGVAHLVGDGLFFFQMKKQKCL